SGEEKVVAKCGQRPPRVSAPEKDLMDVKLGVTVNPDRKTYFDRFYVCFNRLADRWKAVVNVENKYNWTWFLELLEEDLGCNRGNGLTLMSDQHKGLIEAVKDVTPNAEHRQCARHIYENFRKQYLGLEFRQLFWAASKASYPQLFNKIIDKIKSANPNAHKFLMINNPKSWFWYVIYAGGKLFEVRSRSEGFTVDEGYLRPDQSMYSTVLPPKPRKMPGRLKKKRIRAISEGGSSTRVSKIGSRGSFSNCKQHGHNKSSCKEPVVEQTPKPKGVAGRPRKKQPVDNFEDVDVVQRGPVRDEGASGTRGGVIWSRGKGGVAGSRGGASGSIGRGAGRFGDASGSRGRGSSGLRGGASGSRGKGVGGSKRKPVSTAKTQKKQGKKKVETSGFAKWFGLQDEPEQSQDEPEKTQAEPQQTQHDPKQTQFVDHVEQTKDQAEIDLTQVEQTQEKVQPQEQPQQAALRMPSARIL
ncbi:multidrug resistance-associated protein 5, partial [Tanacetum coccineum]